MSAAQRAGGETGRFTILVVSLRSTQLLVLRTVFGEVTLTLRAWRNYLQVVSIKKVRVDGIISLAVHYQRNWGRNWGVIVWGSITINPAAPSPASPAAKVWIWYAAALLSVPINDLHNCGTYATLTKPQYAHNTPTPLSQCYLTVSCCQLTPTPSPHPNNIVGQ
ncbi:hypothetical protein BU25DRAFT_414499 [Macroventuria anomochaeta]|uniref:Uncharacterized protein n=1 Tax=Macroventuria anomochaeta TaxID=301207 RepID=A0ACB6RMX8_9PLEO|nr:uncharacterized protein BU25DRAFT_414499 [Macroventuria anomochaeta]KAF2623236.1 hypothetical protein BU25DRAFT_414499 [Macroventuria anomochaeta]